MKTFSIHHQGRWTANIFGTLLVIGETADDCSFLYAAGNVMVAGIGSRAGGTQIFLEGVEMTPASFRTPLSQLGADDVHAEDRGNWAAGREWAFVPEGGIA